MGSYFLGCSFKVDISRDRVFGISVNIPTKAVCPVFCSYAVKLSGTQN